MIIILEEKDFYQNTNDRFSKYYKAIGMADIVIDKPNRKVIKTRYNFKNTIRKLRELDELKGIDVFYALQ